MSIHPREHIAARLTGGDPGEPGGAFAQVVEALGRLDDVLAPFEWELLEGAPDELLLMLANAASELGRLESGEFPFDWRFEPATVLVQLLHAADLPAAAVRLLASVLDWQGDTAGERARRLRARLRPASLEWRGQAVGLLASLLAMADQGAMALKLYEDDLGVEQSEDLPRQLQLRLDALSFEDGLALVVPFAGLCVVARGMATAAAVLEAYLDLSPEGYSVENVRRGLEARGWTGDPAQPAQLLNLAAWANQDIGRGSEADVLIDALLEAQDQDAGPPRGGPLEQLIARLASLRDAINETFDPALAAPVLGTTLALIPNRLDPPSLLQVVLRVVAERSKVDEQALARMADWARSAQALPGAAETYGLNIAQCLGDCGRPEQGLRLAAAVIGVGDEDSIGASDDGPPSVPAMDVAIQRLPTRLGPPAARIFAELLDKSGQRRAALALMASELGFDAARVGSAEEVAAQLRRPDSKLISDWAMLALSYTRTACAESTAPTVGGPDARVRSAMLWHVLALEADPAAAEGAAYPVCEMLIDYFAAEALAETNDARLLDRCRSAMNYLRRLLDVYGNRLDDRKRYTQHLRRLRRLIPQCAERALNGLEGHDREALRTDILLWDIELGQRVLYERLRFARAGGGRAKGDVKRPLADGWSLGEPSAPPFGGGKANVGLACLGVAAPSEPAEQATSFRTPNMGRLPVLENVVRSGVAEADVARVLGPRGVLLRGGFSESGALRWAAYRGDGAGRLRLVASGESATSDAREAVTAAVEWHDGLVGLLWAETGLAERPLRAICREVHGYLRPKVEALANPPKGFGDRPTPAADVANYLAAGWTHQIDQSKAAAFVAGKWLPEQSAMVAAEADDAARVRRLARLADVLKACADGSTTQALDAVTDVFLQRVADVWNLAPLLATLEDPLDADLVVEVEGVLHAVPVAYLPVAASAGDGPPQRLFERVRSVRNSLSMLLSIIHDVGFDGSENAADGVREFDDGDVVTISWFRPNDANRETLLASERRLHAGQRAAAGRASGTARRWRSAASEPPGSAAAIRAATAGPGGVRLLTVYGHGELYKHGVNLHDPAGVKGESRWSADDCDLARVDWLLLVCCSIGRLRDEAHAGVPDVEGFVADLAARRMRSALACRWPVDSRQAARFANLLAAEYLRGSAAAESLRARSLAAAREKILRRLSGGQSGCVLGLNTLAAMELFGES